MMLYAPKPSAGSTSPGRRSAGLRQLLAVTGAGLLLAGCLGCRTGLDVSNLKDDETTRRLAQTDDVKGPLERILPAAFQRVDENSPEYLAQLDAETQAARAEFEKAAELYEQEQYRQAEKAARRIAKKFKETPVREEALFLAAEALYAQQEFADAQDTYAELLEDYPSTRYLDRVTRRLFEIARTWLGFPDVATTSEIQMVSFEEDANRPISELTPKESQTSSDPTYSIPVLPNFHDSTRPIFDTPGRALQALKSIWLNDPTGPLADDALMLTASHYLRKGDYVEADRYFSILREEYPKSDHLQDAFILGSHVKLMSYQGAVYDRTNLDEARSLKESALRLFPENNDRKRLEAELAAIAEAQARRDWEMVQFYQRKRRPKAVAVYCMQILERHPRSSYADEARRILAELGPEATRGFPGHPGREPLPDLVPVPTDETDTASPNDPTPSRAPKSESTGRVQL